MSAMESGRRLAITAALLWVAASLGRLPVPGLEYTLHRLGGADLLVVNWEVLALGVVLAFGLTALLSRRAGARPWPRTRRFHLGIGFALTLATLQGHFIARHIDGMGPEFGGQYPLIVGAVLGFTGLQLLLALAIGHFGALNGFSALLALEILRRAWWLVETGLIGPQGMAGALVAGAAPWVRTCQA